jgi:hypothetical protein
MWKVYIVQRVIGEPDRSPEAEKRKGGGAIYDMGQNGPFSAYAEVKGSSPYGSPNFWIDPGKADKTRRV